MWIAATPPDVHFPLTSRRTENKQEKKKERSKQSPGERVFFTPCLPYKFLAPPPQSPRDDPRTQGHFAEVSPQTSTCPCLGIRLNTDHPGSLFFRMFSIKGKLETTSTTGPCGGGPLWKAAREPLRPWLFSIYICFFYHGKRLMD